jgi:uncharacterized protein YkwD
MNTRFFRLVAVGMLLIPTAPGFARDHATPDPGLVGTIIIAATNDLRTGQGRPALAVDPRLTEAAREFAAFMARTDKYGHDADGTTPSARARKHGFDYCLIAENIAYQYSSAGFETAELARKFFDGWRASAPHRKNMLEKGATHTGVAIARSGKSGKFYAVQMFGRPRAKSC